ncbi:TetR/AcrR family transcriptional regulator [Limosilactobacillus kribbianus]|uniref:TetR/AcrR family transcriptional regulator n=1 Tax=Limosilactobacillus kribbianus TaxID=2982695 RepID=UPI0022653ACB|nr:TetR/AcrR family transcriptional regulator [Limosilactobacillus kribbianus]
MPSQTFINLKDAKKQRVRTALLNEFSQHSLATAEVARIIKNAQISRGAFYKYFADLTDAYLYLLQEVLVAIHVPLGQTEQQLAASDYYQMVAKFVDRVHQGPYYQFVRNHFLTNEGILPQENGTQLEPQTDTQWAVMTLCHATIKECLLAPDDRARALARLKKMLKKITE